VPATLHDSTLNTADTEAFAGRMMPGAAAADAPVTRSDGSTGWLLRELGTGFTALIAAGPDSDPLARSIQDFDGLGARVKVLRVATGPDVTGADMSDKDGLLIQRYDLRPGTVYLFRPDQHVCARWRAPTAVQVKSAVKRALAII
jgi:3-(3-hydroxy-phenyl)propionate hydroxylase